MRMAGSSGSDTWFSLSWPGFKSQDRTKLTEATFDQDVDVATLNTFCCSQNPWLTKSLACISSDCLFEMSLSSFILFAPQICVDFLLIGPYPNLAGRSFLHHVISQTKRKTIIFSNYGNKLTFHK